MEMRTQATILTRLLPKTGKVFSHQDGDDGYYQAGWWKGLSLANNKVRFVTKTLAGDVVVIDNATGLMWVQDGTSAGGNNGVDLSWSEALTAAFALTFAGFADWRLPNIKELFSLFDATVSASPFPEDLFIDAAAGGKFWSSTMRTAEIGYALTLDRFGDINPEFVADDHFMFAVRGGV